MSSPDAARPPGRRGLALSAVLYLATSLWTMSDALFAEKPSLLVSYQQTSLGIVQLADQRMVLSDVSMNASRLLRDPASVGSFGQCFPIDRPFRLGEHAFGEALLTAPFVAFGLDPARALTMTIVLQRWLGALGMFLLARRLTESTPAAFVAGFLFGFGHNRLADPVHPFVWGDHWMPWAMLFVHRLMDRERWSDALGLGAAVALMIGESIYVLIPAAIVGTIWFVYLARRTTRRLLPLSGKLLAAAVLPIAVGWLVLGPYLTADELVRFQSVVRLYVLPQDFLPGRLFFPGMLLAVLAAIGSFARSAGTICSRFGDPRPWIAFGAVAVWLCAIEGIPVPGFESLIPSPLVLAREWIPVLSAVRAIPSVSSGVYLCLALLAGFGVRALTLRLPVAAAALVAGAFALFWLGELYAPVLGRASFGAELRLEPIEFSLGKGDEELIARIEGPVVDVSRSEMRNVGDSFILAAHHRKPIGACHQSLPSRWRASVHQLAKSLPEPLGVTALSHLGFTDVLVHAHDFKRDAPPLIEELRSSPGLELVADSGEHALFRLRPEEGQAIAGVRSLQVEAHSAEAKGSFAADRIAIALEISNPSAGVFVPPLPLRLVPVTVRWKDLAGNTVRVVHEKIDLPAALLPGRTARRRLVVPAPPPGNYTADVELEGHSAPILFAGGGGVTFAAMPEAKQKREQRASPVRALRLETDPEKQLREASSTVDAADSLAPAEQDSAGGVPSMP